MTLSAGARLGPYEIVAPLGAGGMGEVYRARDTRLDRTVAVKVIPEALASDPSLRDRFEREARAISSLQHPNICALFDVGEAPRPSAAGPGATPSAADAIRFLVLEYLDGETLATRIERSGALTLNDALKIAIEIAEALDAAHRTGIVHRDLKPANVFLARTSGSATVTAKLLDFGLAKPAQPVLATSGLSMLPTTPPTLTAQGTILGTFQYMAPEQIEGIEADARTDIFAFGAVLFEMLTGRTAFDGQTRAALLGSILKDTPPPISSLQPAVPGALDHVLARCLAKAPDDRWQSARDVLHELRWIASGAAHAPASAPSSPEPKRHRRWMTMAAVAVASATAGAALATLLRTPQPAAAIQFTLPPPPAATFDAPPSGGTGIAVQAAVAPDGQSIVLVARSRDVFHLWLRPLGAQQARLLPGTEGASFPFWSPDSRHIGFFAGNKLKRVSVAGGPPLELCAVTAGRGGTWSRDNVIVFTPGTAGVLQRVSASGGQPADISVLDADYGETNHRFPWFLPDGQHYLYTASVGTCCPVRKAARIKIGRLDTTEAATLMSVESSVIFANGHLFFNRGGTLMAQSFDASSRTLSGEPIPIVDDLSMEGSRYATFSASQTGVVAYARGQGQFSSKLEWFDRSGRQIGTLATPGGYINLALSPDERRVVVAQRVESPFSRSLWTIDVGSGAKTRLTFDAGLDTAPIWSMDNQRIVFMGARDGTPRLLQLIVAGVGKEELLLDGRSNVTPTDWASDGKILYSVSQATAGSTDLAVLDISGDRKPRVYLESPAFENDAVLSPDRKWVAYMSDETGQPDVFVMPFPPTGGKFQISTGGGTNPVWRRDGRELFYLTGDQLMAAAIDPADGFQFKPPAPLFSARTRALAGGTGKQFAVSRDGTRFLVNVPEERDSIMTLTVVTNWTETLQR